MTSYRLSLAAILLAAAACTTQDPGGPKATAETPLGTGSIMGGGAQPVAVTAAWAEVGYGGTDDDLSYGVFLLHFTTTPGAQAMHCRDTDQLQSVVIPFDDLEIDTNQVFTPDESDPQPRVTLAPGHFPFVDEVSSASPPESDVALAGGLGLSPAGGIDVSAWSDARLSGTFTLSVFDLGPETFTGTFDMPICPAL